MNFLFWLFTVFFLIAISFRLFLRFVFPWLMTRFLKKQQEKFYQAGRSGFESRRPEGEVEINVPRKKSSKKDTDFGEYVDFEEEPDES